MALHRTGDPKPEKRATDKLSRRGWRGPLDANEEDRRWRRKGHSEEQILRALRQAEERHQGGRHLPRARDQRSDVLHLEEEVLGTGLSELRELRQLREENGKLKRLVADLSLDRHILQEIVQKKL